MRTCCQRKLPPDQFISPILGRFVCKCKKGQIWLPNEEYRSDVPNYTFQAHLWRKSFLKRKQTYIVVILRKQVQSAEWAKKQHHLNFTPFPTQDLSKKINKYKTTRHRMVKQNWRTSCIAICSYVKLKLPCFYQKPMENFKFSIGGTNPRNGGPLTKFIIEHLSVKLRSLGHIPVNSKHKIHTGSDVDTK